MEEQKVKKTKRKPTPKQIKGAQAVVENLLKDKPLTTGKVLENVGYGTTSQTPANIIQSEGFQEALQSTGLQKALQKAGINPEKIAEKIGVLLDAHKVIYKNNNATGEVEEVGKEIDFTAVDKGLKHATNIYGVLGEKDKPNTVVYNFFNNPTIQAQVKAFEDKVKEELKQ